MNKKIALVAATVSALVLAPNAGSGTPQALSSNSPASMTAQWWQWAFSIPNTPVTKEGEGSIHPLVGDNDDFGDPTFYEFCGNGQHGDVWFLGGDFSGTGEPFERTCTIPYGKTILRSCLEKQFIYLQALGNRQFEHGDPDHIFSGGDENLEILRQSPEMAQPGERPFHDPALGDHLKLTFFSRRFPRDMESQFQFFADKSFRGTPIAGIARKGLNGGITLHGGFQNRTGGQGIGNIRGMNVNGKKVPQNIHDEVAFASLHLFVAINAALLASILSFNAL